MFYTFGHLKCRFNQQKNKNPKNVKIYIKKSSNKIRKLKNYL